jgi:hypothetical protein
MNAVQKIGAMCLIATFAVAGCEPMYDGDTDAIPAYEEDADLTGNGSEDEHSPSVNIEVGEGVDVEVGDGVDLETDPNGVDVDVDPTSPEPDSQIEQ